MKLLADARLYTDTDACLRFLRGLAPAPEPTPAPAPERFHFYWHGRFGRKQAFALKSFLATQEPSACEPWLWLDGESGHAGHADQPWLRPLLPFFRILTFDPKREARDTPLAERLDLADPDDPRQRSNFQRFAVLYKYGGTYADLDVMFLRDLQLLFRNPAFPDEFCYRWSAQPWGNAALLRLRRVSPVARALLERCVTIGSCRNRRVLNLQKTGELGVLPAPFFDPLWLHADGADRFEAAPFSRFEEFFQRFDERFRPRPEIRSRRDFFPGALAYHWHNCWDAPEHADSYFGRFERELDAELRDGLGVEAAAPV